jgi:uncharacterized membrane protein YhaH (DUF805 family)
MVIAFCGVLLLGEAFKPLMRVFSLSSVATENGAFLVLNIALILFLRWFQYCLLVNRLHDIGASGVFAFLPLAIALGLSMPFSDYDYANMMFGGVGPPMLLQTLNIVLAITLLWFDGNDASNRYGRPFHLRKRSPSKPSD